MGTEGRMLWESKFCLRMASGASCSYLRSTLGYSTACLSKGNLFVLLLANRKWNLNKTLHKNQYLGLWFYLKWNSSILPRSSLSQLESTRNKATKAYEKLERWRVNGARAGDLGIWETRVLGSFWVFVVASCLGSFFTVVTKRLWPEQF